jgi:hypothetical protein
MADPNHKASIPFRIYAALDESDDESAPKVVLFQSGPPDEPKAGGAKKGPKGARPKGGAAAETDELELK